MLYFSKPGEERIHHYARGTNGYTRENKQKGLKSSTNPPISSSGRLKMSVSAVSTSSFYSPVQNPIRNTSQSIRQDFNQLSKSLSADDLAGAQQAFSALAQALSAKQPAPVGATQVASATQTDFGDLGKALAAGDLKGAQAAFTKLSGDLTAAAQAGGAGGAQRAGHAHHHHGPPPASQKAGSDSDGDGDGSGSNSTANPAGSGSTISLLG